MKIRTLKQEYAQKRVTGIVLEALAVIAFTAMLFAAPWILYVLNEVIK